MQTQQPENPVKLPAEVQKAIEAGRNRVTILEAEIKRLIGLKRTATADIVTVEKQLNEDTTALAGLETAIASSKEKGVEIDAVLATKRDMIENNDTDIVISTKKLMKLEEKSDKIIDEIDKKQEAFALVEKNYQRKSKELSLREENVEKREKNIENFAKNI